MTPAQLNSSLLLIDYPVSLVLEQWLTNLSKLQKEPLPPEDVYRLVTALLMPVTASGKYLNSHTVQVVLGTDGDIALRNEVQAVVASLPAEGAKSSFTDFEAVVRGRWPCAHAMTAEMLPLLLQIGAHLKVRLHE